MQRLEQMAATAEDIRRVVAGVEQWLFSGVAQSRSGAFCAWRDGDTGEFAFDYPEITGYALTLASSMRDPEPVVVHAARRAAEWLVGRLASGDRSARAGWDGEAIYTFDLAMIATALMAFGRTFGGEYTNAGAALVEYLDAEIRAAGKLPAIARGPRASHTGWAVEGRAHLLKVVQCLLLARETAGLDTHAAAQTLIAEASELQRPEGRFVTDPRDETTMLHPHHYALEGLWIWGCASSDDWALERARHGLEWAFEHQLPSGGFPRSVENASGVPGPEQADATAQAVRMAYLLELEPAGLERAVCRVAELTVEGEHGRAAVYQPDATPLHENIWASVFAAQALRLAAGDGRIRWDLLA